MAKVLLEHTMELRLSLNLILLPPPPKCEDHSDATGYTTLRSAKLDAHTMSKALTTLRIPHPFLPASLQAPGGNYN
ncbi:hypothetical protein STEG23_030145 [Scotinomys teguina]